MWNLKYHLTFLLNIFKEKNILNYPYPSYGNPYPLNPPYPPNPPNPGTGLGLPSNPLGWEPKPNAPPFGRKNVCIFLDSV